MEKKSTGQVLKWKTVKCLGNNKPFSFNMSLNKISPRLEINMTLHKKARDRCESEWNWTHHYQPRPPLRSTMLSVTKCLIYLNPVLKTDLGLRIIKDRGAQEQQLNKIEIIRVMQRKTATNEGKYSYYKWRSHLALVSMVATVADINKLGKSEWKYHGPNHAVLTHPLLPRPKYMQEKVTLKPQRHSFQEKGSSILSLWIQFSAGQTFRHTSAVNQGHLTWAHGRALRSPWTL